MVTRSELRNVLALVVVTTVVSSLVVAPVFASDEVRESAQEVSPEVAGPNENGGYVIVDAEATEDTGGTAGVGVNTNSKTVGGMARTSDGDGAAASAGASGVAVSAAGQSQEVSPGDRAPVDPDYRPVDPSDPPSDPDATVHEPSTGQNGVGVMGGFGVTLDQDDGPGTDVVAGAGTTTEQTDVVVDNSGSEGDVQASSSTQPNEQTTQNRFAARDNDGDRVGSAGASRTDPSFNEDVTITEARVGFGQGVDAHSFTLYRAGVLVICDSSERLRDRCKITNLSPSMARMFPQEVRDAVALKDTPANITWGNALGLADLVWKNPSDGMGTIVYPAISDSPADPPVVNPEEDYSVDPTDPPSADDVDPSAEPTAESHGNGGYAIVDAEATDDHGATAGAGVNAGGPAAGGIVNVASVLAAHATASDDPSAGASVQVGDGSYGADTDDGASLPVETSDE